MDILYSFYTLREIKKIYRGIITFDSCEAAMKEEKIKGKTNE